MELDSGQVIAYPGPLQVDVFYGLLERHAEGHGHPDPSERFYGHAYAPRPPAVLYQYRPDPMDLDGERFFHGA